jgi:hypothetical protein
MTGGSRALVQWRRANVVPYDFPNIRVQRPGEAGAHLAPSMLRRDLAPDTDSLIVEVGA